MKPVTGDILRTVIGAGRDPWRGLALLALLFMELGWITPWAHMIFTTERQDLSLLRVFLVFGGILFTGYLLVRSSDGFRLPDSLSRLLLGGYFFGCVLAGLKGLFFFQQGAQLADFFQILGRLNQPGPQVLFLLPVEIIAIPVLLFAALRGAVLAKKLLFPSLVVSCLRFGLVMYLFYGIAIAVLPAVMSLIDGVSPAVSPGLMPAVFILSGLLAMSAARISALRHLRGGHRIPFDQQRVTGIALPVLVWGVLSIFFGSIVSSQWLFALFGGMYTLFVRTITILIMPILWLFVGQGNRQLEWGELEQAVPTLAPLPTPLPLEGAAQHGQAGLEQLPAWSSPLAVGAGILLAALVMLLFLWARGRGEFLRRGIQEQGPITRPTGLRRSQAGGVTQASDLGKAERVRAAVRIRRIYADLMDLGAQLGHPRPESNTPLEYLNTLYILFPSLPSEVEGITAAYLKVRYGEYPETRRQVRAVDTAWRRICREGKALVAEHRRRAVKKAAPLQ